MALQRLVAVAPLNSSSTLHHVLSSEDGITWTVQTTPDAAWNAVAYSPELGLFVAVAGTVADIHSVMTSPDGITWTLQAALTALWKDVCWVSELGLFVAISSNGDTNQIMTSPDGINWTLQTNPTNRLWSCIVWAPELNLLVAGATDGGVMSSPDGVNWTFQAVVASAIYDMDWSGIYFATSNRNDTTYAYSINGINWTVIGSDLPGGGTAIAGHAAVWIGTTVGVICRSTNITSPFPAPVNSLAYVWEAVIWSEALQLFVASSSGSGSPPTANRIATSPDGITWTVRTTPANAEFALWTSIASAGESPFICDSDYADVVLLLRADTTLSDVSGVADQVNVIGGGAISALQAKFGDDSFKNPGTASDRTNYVEVLAPTNEYVFPADFTMEGWFFLSSYTQTYTHFFCSRELWSNLGYWFFQVNSSGVLAWSNNDSVYLTTPAVFTLNSWHHVAVTRQGNTVRIFVDGIKQAQSTPLLQDVGVLSGGNSAFLVGTACSTIPADNGDMNGYFEEIRVTKGVARYIADFYPPSVPMLGSCSASVPDIIGELAFYADEDILAAGLIVGAVTSELSFSVPVGMIISQSPLAGASVDPGSAVDYVISLGVPNENLQATLFDDELPLIAAIGARLNVKESVSAPPLGENGRSRPMLLGRYNQRPTDNRKRGIIYKDFLEEDEVITGIYDVVVSPVTNPPFEVTQLLVDPQGKKIAYYASGGVDGENYTVAFRVKTNANQDREDTMRFSIQVEITEDGDE